LFYEPTVATEKNARVLAVDRARPEMVKVALERTSLSRVAARPGGRAPRAFH